MSLAVTASHAYRNRKMKFKSLRRSPFNMNLGGVHGTSNCGSGKCSRLIECRTLLERIPLFVAVILMDVPELLAARPAYCTSFASGRKSQLGVFLPVGLR